MEKQKALEYGINNIKVAPYRNGKPSTEIIPVPNAVGLSLAAAFETFEKYADNRKIVEVPSDQGRKGTVSFSTRSYALEEALGYITKKIGNGGFAEIKANYLPRVALYCEKEVVLDDGTACTAKYWYYGCQISKSNDETSTKTNTITSTDAQYPITVFGVPVLEAEGASTAKDDKGFDLHCFCEWRLIDDEDFETFGDSVPEPRVEDVEG